jgi:hypothetical protein
VDSRRVLQRSNIEIRHECNEDWATSRASSTRISAGSSAVRRRCRGVSDGSEAGHQAPPNGSSNHEGQQYLQQICKYLGPQRFDGKLDTGRLFAVNYGIVGQALEEATVLRTRHYAVRDIFDADLRSDFIATDRDLAKLATEPLSWLAVPFQARDGQPVLVLYAECHEFNFFADDARVRAVVNMCWGFARLVDSLEKDSLPNLRNFAFHPGTKVTGAKTVYERVQERAKQFSVPEFQVLKSFNFESSVS